MIVLILFNVLKNNIFRLFPCHQYPSCVVLLYFSVLDLDIYLYNIDNVSVQLSYFEQQQLDEILNDFRDVFPSELPHGLPPKHNIDHRIDIVPGVAPISIPPYRLSRSAEDEVSKQLKDYLRMGYIHYSKSTWGAPVLLVQRKEGTWCMCINY